MNSPGVAQLQALADLFEKALRYCHPKSVAILGIAGGNGLERIDSGVTNQIVGIDIHPAYLQAVRERYPQLPLRLCCVDLEHQTVNEEAVQLVHAALIFEHAGTEKCLRNAASLVAPDGHLAVVLQRPNPAQADISPTSFQTVRSLGAHFRLVDQSKLHEVVESIGFTFVHQTRRELPSGKAFWLGIFRKE